MLGSSRCEVISVSDLKDAFNSLRLSKALKTQKDTVESYHILVALHIYIRLLEIRLEGIQKLKPPTTVKGCRSLVGMVIFFSLFCLELQK